jgi:uncharacterized membrane protein YqjE
VVDNPPQPAPLLKTLQELWRDLPGLVSDRVELLALELQQAGLALAQIVMLIVVVAIFGVTAWLVLWMAIVAALVAAGLHLAVALGIALLLNALGLGLAAARIQRLTKLLRLPATRRHLTLSGATRPLPAQQADARHAEHSTPHQHPKAPPHRDAEPRTDERHHSPVAGA